MKRAIDHDNVVHATELSRTDYQYDDKTLCGFYADIPRYRQVGDERAVTCMRCMREYARA